MCPTCRQLEAVVFTRAQAYVVAVERRSRGRRGRVIDWAIFRSEEYLNKAKEKLASHLIQHQLALWFNAN
jgi:hypothetical protein